MRSPPVAKAAATGQQASAAGQPAAAPRREASQAAAATGAQAQAAAGGTVLAGSPGASTYNDTPATRPQGIAVGEYNPSAPMPIDPGIGDGKASGGEAPTCEVAFKNADANGDARLELAEWQAMATGAPETEFKSRDADGDKHLTATEYGCQP